MRTAIHPARDLTVLLHHEAVEEGFADLQHEAARSGIGDVRLQTQGHVRRRLPDPLALLGFGRRTLFGHYSRSGFSGRLIRLSIA
ncbi:hypothetical protein D3C73_1527560 [compost metagenome]